MLSARSAAPRGGHGAHPGGSHNRARMHLIVPFAGTVSEAGRQALGTLALPRLERLLGRLAPAHWLGSDEFSLSAPHELALAAERGWDPIDGALPWAAERAVQAGLDAAGRAWARLTPVHLSVEPDRVRLTDPAALELDEAESRELLEAVRPLFEADGIELSWLAPTEWLASHEMFAGLATASLDRVLGRDIDPWLPKHRDARALRRLQNEVQMLLHAQPVNQRREHADRLVVNSFWCDGCGRLAAGTRPVDRSVRIDERLRAPSLVEDWAAWAEAWSELDAGPFAELLERGEDASLTLCGERRALRFAPVARGIWQRALSRWRREVPSQWLDRL